MKQFRIDFERKDRPKVIDTSFIKIRGKTIVFENIFYSIPNIASVQVVDLTKYKRFPWISIILLAFLGYVLLRINFPTLAMIRRGGIQFITPIAIYLLLVLLCLYSIISYFASRYKYNFGLYILSNAGPKGSTIIENNDKDFLEQIAVVLYDIINDEDYKNVNFNIDNRTIVDSSTGVVINSGTVSGKIVSRIN